MAKKSAEKLKWNRLAKLVDDQLDNLEYAKKVTPDITKNAAIVDKQAVTAERVASFNEIASWLAGVLFGQSDCFMPWVNVRVVDLTRFNHMHYEPVPDTQMDSSTQEHWERVRSAQLNMTIASEELDRALKIYELHVREKEIRTERDKASVERVSRNVVLDGKKS